VVGGAGPARKEIRLGPLPDRRRVHGRRLIDRRHEYGREGGSSRSVDPVEDLLSPGALLLLYADLRRL
jgi:hypothetical protein